MFRNYIKTAWRNVTRNKIYAAINISGIAIGLAASWLIALYVSDELSYDRSFTNTDRVYRLAQHATWPSGSMNLALTSAPFSAAFKTTFPEVEDAARTVGAAFWEVFELVERLRIALGRKEVTAGPEMLPGADPNALALVVYHPQLIVG